MPPDLRRLIINRYKTLGLTRDTLSKKAGVSRETLSKWLHGVNKTTNTDLFARIMHALDLVVAREEELRPVEPKDEAIQRLKSQQLNELAAKDAEINRLQEWNRRLNKQARWYQQEYNVIASKHGIRKRRFILPADMPSQP
jgi:transcriptional regulator with XRE-family HTH domain